MKAWGGYLPTPNHTLAREQGRESLADLEKDLPDPLDAPAGGPAADPDDLVAQLAGDAIDRLLEDAEKGIVPPRPPPEDDPLNEIDPPVTKSLEADLEPPDAVEVAPSVTVDVATPAPAVEVSTPDPVDEVPQPATVPDEPDADVPPAMQAELDSLFNSLGGDASDASDDPDPSPPPDALAAQLAPETPAPDVEDVQATPQAEPDISPASRTAMPPPVDVPPEIANDDGHGGALAAEDDRPADLDNDASLQTDVKQLLDDATHHAPAAAPAFIVAPLRLLNAPFAGLSDDTRDLLGQIALVTLVNALAIMLYVILFR